MKKIKLSIIVIIFLALVVGAFVFISNLTATKNQEAEMENLQNQLSSGFTAKATVDLNDVTAVMDINKTSANKLTFNIVEPTVLKDLLFDYDGENVNISYNGLSLSLGKDSIITKSMVSVLINAINSATQPQGLEFNAEDDALIVNGLDENGEFSLKLDKETGNFLNLSYPSMDLECQFDDFVFTKNNAVQ